jgi:hypothetical protein
MGSASEVATGVAVATGALVVAGACIGVQAVSAPTRVAINKSWRMGCVFIKFPLHFAK